MHLEQQLMLSGGLRICAGYVPTMVVRVTRGGPEHSWQGRLYWL